MESSEALALLIVLVVCVIVVWWLSWHAANDHSQKIDDNVNDSEQQEQIEVNSPLYDALSLIVSTPSETVVSEIIKYVTRAVIKGCEEIKQNTPNVMLCGVRVKEYIANARSIYKENAILLALSGLSKENFDKLIDGVCISIHDKYFGNLNV